ncbi:hypothetical protein [Spiroplasma chrysopicola]|uniref:Uncharacterized protein n=1 Tax=Spiroplasma chrysopicola DF-1 TaxID=1276227 RepID=R4UJI1_9MOLU|nr:hypothetical protein [Spiroplasma chrysopicola]AGM25466.1 hypothetical protein SCHRY_v1c08930 [Spiroplasma chrysopicola DF-1]
METEIYQKVITCLENIRMHLKISQLEFAAFLSLTREGYRLAIAKDTNRHKQYIKLDLIHIFSAILFNLENYQLWRENLVIIQQEINSCFTNYYLQLLAILPVAKNS